MTTAWNGTRAEFWACVKAVAENRGIESDYAVLCEVLDLAQKQNEHEINGTSRDASGPERENGR